MRTSRYHQILRNWIGRARNIDLDENQDHNEEIIGVVSSIPKLNELIKPLNELPNNAYFDVLIRYKYLLQELRIRLIEIFKRNIEKYKIQYKLDIVDEKMTLIEELGQEVYKLSAQDLSEIHTQKDKEECLLVDKFVPVNEKVEEIIDIEEEKFLLELSSQLNTKLGELNNELVRFQAQISEVEKQLKDVDESSHNFIIDAVETFQEWSRNAMGIIKAVEKAN